ncbi:hypothetical protein [Mycolicibacterium phlei]
MEFELVMSGRVPVWLVRNSAHRRVGPGSAWNRELYPQMANEEEFFERLPVFRGVSPERFLNVLITGVDVEPTDAPIYCAEFDKAWEYGGTSVGESARLIMALDRSKLERTFTTLPSSATPEEIATVRETYPYQHAEHQGELWFSRIDRYFPAYEVPYGYWIPGDATEALLAIFLVGDDDFWRDEMTRVHALFTKMLESRSAATSS